MAWQCLELEVAAEFGEIRYVSEYERDLELDDVQRLRRERDTERHQERARSRALAGLCRCGNARSDDGCALCRGCRKSQRKWRDANKATGSRCVCGKPRSPGMKSCQVCLDKMRARRAAWKEAGICRTCGTGKTPQGRATCLACAAKQRAKRAIPEDVRASRRAARIAKQRAAALARWAARKATP